MTGFRWQQGPGRGSTWRSASWWDGAAAANDSPGGAGGGARVPPLDDILAPFLPDAPAEVIDLANHAFGRGGASGEGASGLVAGPQPDWRRSSR